MPSIQAIQTRVKSMSIRRLDNLILDILESNGKTVEEADKILDSMTLEDKEKYLSDALNA